MADYLHSVLEEIKIPVVLDGDLAATIFNAFKFVHEVGGDEGMFRVLFCDHAAPKLNALLEVIETELDIENKEEK